MSLITRGCRLAYDHRPVEVPVATAMVEMDDSCPISPQNYPNARRYGSTSPVKRCYRCQSTQHLIRSCPRRRCYGSYGDQPRGHFGTATVNYCSVVEDTNGHGNGSRCYEAEFDMVGSEALPNSVINSVTVSQENSGVELVQHQLN